MRTKRIIAALLAVVMLFAFTACKDEKKDLSASLANIFEDGNMKVFYQGNPDLFMRAAQNEFKISEAEAQSFTSNPDDWTFYNLNVRIVNKTEKKYTFIAFAGSEMPDGIWLSSSPINGELTLAAGETMLYPASVLINNSKATVNQMYDAVAKLKLELLYCETPADENAEVTESDCDRLEVENKLVAPEDNDVKVEDEVSAKRATVEADPAYLAPFKTNSVAFMNESKLYGIDSETAVKIIAENSTWESYRLNIDLTNKTGSDLTVYKIVSTENGKNGVWISSLSEYGEFGMMPNDTQSLPVTVLVDTSALGGKTVQDVIASMPISLEYIAGEVIDDFGNESILPTRTVTVE